MKPHSSGARTFTLEFYHANYPSGVRDKAYSLTTIERNKEYILAVSNDHDPKRTLLIFPITNEWLKTHFSASLERDQTAEQWLEKNA